MSSRAKVCASTSEPPAARVADADLDVDVTAKPGTPSNWASHAATPSASTKTKAPAQSSSLMDWVRRPRRTFQRRVARPLQRRYKQLSWTSRETVSVAIVLYALVYILISVPLRIGFFYDPIEPTKISHWTEPLTVFSVLDVISDTIGLCEFIDFYRTWQDAFSQLSQSVSFEVGKKLSKKSHSHEKPKISTRNRQTNSVRSSQAQWTLATLAPAAVAAAQSSEAVSRRKRIEITLEIIALMPIEVIVLATRQYNLLHVLRLTKLCRAYRVYECLDKISRIYGDRRWIQSISLTGISTLVRNIAVGVLLCHWFACGYMLIAHRTCGIELELCDPAIESSWVIRDRLMGATITRRYGRAVYWSSRTMVVLGYDDVTPVSNAETVYGLFIQLFGAMLSTSLLATFLFIFRFRMSRQAAFNTHVDNAREYMKSQHMPRELRRQVTAYFSYAWATHHSLDGEEALHLLPKHLESKIVYTLKASRIKQVCFLMKESVEFINLLALALVHRVYIPSDSIIEPKINAKMFFVIRGTVILSAFDGSHPKECQKGDFFADCCLLTPETYEEKAVAKTFCELYVLEKSAFDEAIGHFYRGLEQETIDRMVQTLERYATQLRKTKKLLGLRGAEDEVASSPGAKKRAISSSSTMGMLHSTRWRLPGSVARIRWDLVRLMAIVYIAFEVPFYIVFISNHDAQENFVVSQDFGGRYVATLLIEIFFACDFILRCRFFAYLDPVVMINVVDPGMILAAYKSNGFYADLLAVLPITLVMESLRGIAEDYSWIFRLLRLLRVRSVGDLLQDITDFYSVSSKIQLIMSLVLGVALMLHMVACLWFEMSWVPLTSDNTHGNSALTDITRQECLRMATLYQNCSWVRYDCYGNVGVTFPFEDASSPYKTTFAYIRSIYWAVVALTGVGYGDIVAFSTAESYFAAVWIYIGGIINFGIVGAMSSTISNLLVSQHHHVEKLNTLNSIMEHLSITQNLRGEIRRFYHHHFKTRKNAYESELLQHLPDQLCYRISSLLHAGATKRVLLFESASREFLEEVTGKFRHRTYQNGETLYIEGDICKEFVVLTHGKVNMFHQSKPTCPVGALVAHECYGANEFLLKRPHAVTLISVSPIHASVMTQEHFDVILRKYADEMNDIRDEAYDMWVEDSMRLAKIVKNLDSLKLKPHVISTPSLFYQRELNRHSSGLNRDSSRRTVNRDGPASRQDVEDVRSRNLGVWNFVLTFWNIYSAFTIVFRITFHSKIYEASAQFHSTLIIDLVCDFCYAADIYLKLYYFDCEEVGLENLLTRVECNLAYRASRHFKRDLLASLPFYYISEATPLATDLCRLPRLLRTFDLWGYIDETIILIQQTFASKNVSAYLSPMKLLFFLLLGSHFAACVFFYISEDECEADPIHCWMAHDHILHQYEHSLMVLYLRCFYWALTSLTLVGSREIVPRNIPGTLWATLTCLGTTFIMGYIIGEISELILDMGKEEKEYKDRIDSFEHFAKEHGLSEVLRSRVALFFKVQFEHTHGKELDEAVHDMSANLKLKFMHEIYGSAIARLPISRFLTYAQVNNLALRLKSELFIPGDDIVVEDTFGTRLCVVRTGIAAVLWSESVSSVAVLMSGCLFGEVAFFLPRQRRIATVKATTSCEVLHITKHAWNELWGGGGGKEENHMQTYALHSILDWVKGRMLSYQESALNVAKRANRLLMERKIMENLQGMMAPVQKAVLKFARTSHKQSYLTPEATVLEKKAKYLLLRADKYSNQHEQLVHDAGQMAGMSTVSMNYDHGGHHRSPQNHHDKQHIGVPASGGPHAKHQKNNKALKTVDLNFGQFFVNVNPVNKHVAPHIDDHHLKLLEDECWHRFRYMVALQHTISDLMEALVPREATHHHHQQKQNQRTATPVSAPKPQPPPTTNNPYRISIDHPHRRHEVKNVLDNAVPLRRMHTFHTYDSVSVLHHKKSAAVIHRQSISSTPGDQRLFTASNPAATSNFPSRRLESQQSGRLVLTRAISITSSSTTSPDPWRAGLLRRLRRCRSLPSFDKEYFAKVKQQEDKSHRTRRGAVSGMESALMGTTGINFDILQRSRRPKLSALYQLYRRFIKWRDGIGSTDSSNDSNGRSKLPDQPRNASRLTISAALRQFKASTNSTASSKTSKRHSSIRWQRAQQQHVRGKDTRADATAAAFQTLVKKCSKSWDLLMLLIAVYHAVVAPLKVCFRHDLEGIHGLKIWSGIEYFMDILCVIDIGHRLRRSRAQLEHGGSTHHPQKGHRKGKFALIPSHFSSLPLYDGFTADLIAVFPLELFALAEGGVVAWDGLPYGSKWLHLSFLRLTKTLFTRRIQGLSESVFQYAVYDLRVPIVESLLYFLRSLAAFLLMGHWMACMWFAVSEKAFEEYASSWISCAGMLVFAVDSSAPTSAVSPSTEHHRILSESASSSSSTFDLQSVTLTRKYLRSMHFALSSISTLWYGDIASLNIVDLLFEMLCLLASIYIYGSLVGAHGELLEVHARRKATFEQNLTELQHYLIQNNVPKILKKQIKQYYASIWRRRNGEEEFEAIVGISRALHEDVVYATLHRFAWKVSIFHSLDIHFLRALLVKLQYVVCSEDEEVVIRGDVDRSMYFISHGRILVKQGVAEITKEKGDFFGELALLYGIPRGETCIALTESELYRLDSKPYEELLLEFPEYGPKNKAEWTTAEPPPSMLTSLLHTLSFGAAVHKLTTNGDEGGNGVISVSAILDEEVSRSFVFKSTMELLAQFTDVDSLQAKHIIHRAKQGARKHLKRLTGIETARKDGDVENDESYFDDIGGSRPQSPAPGNRARRKRTRDANDRHPSGSSRGGGSPPQEELQRDVMLPSKVREQD